MRWHYAFAMNTGIRQYDDDTSNNIAGKIDHYFHISIASQQSSG